jgi:hypothetical protein
MPGMTEGRIKQLFINNKIFTASDKELIEALILLAEKTSVDNDQVVKALVINAIRDQRHVDKLHNINKILTGVIIVLTLVSIFLQLHSSFSSYHSSGYNIHHKMLVR